MKKIFLGIGFLVVALMMSLLQPHAGIVRATQNDIQCVEVSAPSPVRFEERIGWISQLMATFEWQESPAGTWTLYMDIDPRGGHEIWVSSYPAKWGFRKPVSLPQTVIEVTCPPEEPELPVGPEPTPTPTPTPTPNPEDGKRTGLGIDKLEVCALEEFEVVMDIKENGEGKKDVEVTFTYNGATKKAKTDEAGRARTSFARNGAGSVQAAADGWDSQSQYVEMPVCEPVALDPDRAIGSGQVLGVSTLADTGARVGIFGGLMTMVGGIITTAGVALAKKN